MLWLRIYELVAKCASFPSPEIKFRMIKPEQVSIVLHETEGCNMIYTFHCDAVFLA